jgi:periplasmic divalent cation tolerance protein
MKAIQVFTTVGTKAKANKFALSLVKAKLAACVQIVGPIQSIYMWKGKIEKAKEYLCIIKTKAELFSSLEQAVLKIHPYEVPEILALPVSQGNRHYLSWLAKEVRKR